MKYNKNVFTSSGPGARKLLAVLVASCLSATAVAGPSGQGVDTDFNTGMVPDRDRPSVQNIRFGLDGDRTRLVLDLSAAPGDVGVGEYRQGQPLLLSLDVEVGDAVIPDRIPGDTVRAVSPVDTAGRFTLAVALSAEPARVEHFALPPAEGRGHRLVVDFYSGTTAHSAVGKPESTAEALVFESDEGRIQPTAFGDDEGLLFQFDDEGALVEESRPVTWFGYGEFSGAYTVSSPSRWSQLRGRFELGASGDLGASARYRLVGRVEGDAAYSVESNYYDSAVRRDQRRDAAIREAYVDFPLGDWEWRVGRQHVVWGEMVGLFLADVVSARDMREFYLQEFENMRIPQWALRSEYFAGDSHFEVLWIPYPSYDEIGKPGADFYPFPVPAGTSVRNERPSRNLSNTNAGIRFSHLVSGWDLSVFHYQSMDVHPTLYSTDTGLELRNDRIRQTGGTFSKAMPSFVFKGEAVYTIGRKYYSGDPLSRYGLESADSLEYVVGVMVPWNDWRFDVQFYGGYLFGYDSGILRDRSETGMTLLVNHSINDRIEWEILYMAGFNRTDYSIQPKVIWNLDQQWRLQFGADIFGGDEVGLFGPYDDSDRLYVELRRWF